MSLCSNRSARRSASAAVLVLGAALAALFWGCGRTPPEAFWEPDHADTVAIDSIVNANKVFFRTGLAELALATMDTQLPGSTAVILRKELRTNPYKQRFRANAMEHWVSNPDYPMDYKFIATLDTALAETTCTVTFMETIPGKLRLQVFRYSRFIKQDTFFPNPSETLLLNRYDTTFTDTDYVLEKYAAATETDTQLGNATGGVVLKKENGAWSIWKYSGGHRYWAPGPDDAPYFFDVVLFNGTRSDTVLLRPDTAHFGIQRFYITEDTLVPTYRRGDSVRMTRLRTNNGNCATYLYVNGKRYEGDQWVKLDESVPLGLNRLHVEHIPAEVFWEAAGKYAAAAWIIPFKVTE